MNFNDISHSFNYNNFLSYPSLSTRCTLGYKGDNPYKRIYNGTVKHNKNNNTENNNIIHKRSFNNGKYINNSTNRVNKLNKVQIEHSIRSLNENYMSNSDRIEISNTKKQSSFGRLNCLSVDKGTASNTTLYVNKKTFNDIMAASTNGTTASWDEMGVDGEKRWIVINGQRFQCPLSKEEKEAFQRAEKRSTLLSVITEHENATKNFKEKKQNHPSLKLSINSNNNLSMSGDNSIKNNIKFENLQHNKPVMDILKEIINKNSGFSITLSV